ncbi:hypothetical protein E4U17_006510 [Claviceps sp. LM77 group G4]|nr:hypothetical protein E4U17_006510 [Claviceps sp. LM77 group G4]KAG6081620.1 hypothetical protein E4U33_006674 [Claviceps sp. LM78 group G4]
MLPEPALTFTIPSLHDGTRLDCRVYHPASLAAKNPSASPWKKHAAVLAHPYAPMGGSYDDPVLGSVAATLLGAGYLVGTFNFRGAGHSAGKTSWTARPERDDYASMVGFTAHYVHFLDPFSRLVQSDAKDQNLDVREGLTDAAEQATRPPFSSSEKIESPSLLLMGGYSYGAMVTMRLPPIEDLLSRFSSPEADSDVAQIRLRAQHLAEQQNLILGSVRASILQAQNPRNPLRQHSGGVRVGGNERERSPRRSHDGQSRRRISLDTEDRARRGVHDLMGKRAALSSHSSGHHWHWGQRRSRSTSSCADFRDGRPLWDSRASETAVAAAGSLEKTCGAEQEAQLEKLPVLSHFVVPRPAYVLISPLQGLVTHLATMSFLPAFGNQKIDHAAQKKLVHNPTLAVFGDNDLFVPVGKLRSWTTKLSSRDGSKFTACEVCHAGHFWTEEGAMADMNGSVGAFANSLL